MKTVSIDDSRRDGLQSEAAPRMVPGDGMKSFVVATFVLIFLLAAAFTVLLRFPQKVDALLNSDEPAHTRHVVPGR